MSNLSPIIFQIPKSDLLTVIVKSVESHLNRLPICKAVPNRFMDNFPHGSVVNVAHLHATKESQVGDRSPKKNSPLSKYVTAAKFILRVMHFAKGFTPNYTRVARASSCSQK